MAAAYGVWVEEKSVSTRGLFIIDAEGTLQYSVVHNLSVGRGCDEVLRVLDALRTGGLCPASWTSADGTIDPEQALLPGRILGHYRIREKLGGGTFGTVFAAWDLWLQRMVALKVLKRKAIESREAVLAEARAAARLNHPNVCTIYAVEEEDGLPVISMEYLDGQPLSDAIQEGLDPDRAPQILAQIASGLAAAHEQNVVHGDFKPANIVLMKDGSAKILDFGLARSQRPASSPKSDVSEEQTHAVTRDVLAHSGVEATIELVGSSETDGIRGTPAYMSPEQAAGLPATPESDVFSFGLTAFEILTGRRAISAETPIQMILKLQHEDLAPELCPQVEEPYRELIAAMLSRNADRRPSLSDVSERLASIQASAEE